MNIGHYRLYELVDRDLKKCWQNIMRTASIGVCRPAQKSLPAGVPFIWCSNNLMVALVTQCFCMSMTGDTRFAEFAARQRELVLGVIRGIFQFTEIGSRFPKDTHLMTVQLTKRPVRAASSMDRCMNVIQLMKGVSITQPDPLAAFQGTGRVPRRRAGLFFG